MSKLITFNMKEVWQCVVDNEIQWLWFITSHRRNTENKNWMWATKDLLNFGTMTVP